MRLVLQCLHLCAWALGMVLASCVHAAGLDLQRLDDQALNLAAYVTVLDDPSGQLELADVRALPHATRFQRVKQPERPLGFGVTGSAMWLKLDLHNTEARSRQTLLEIAYARLAEVDFYTVPTDGQVTHIRSGYTLPFVQRPYRHHFFVLPLELPLQSTLAVYIRIQTPNTMNAPLRLWDRDAFEHYERTDYAQQAAYFGMVLAMVLFNLMLGLSLRDLNYLLYVGFVVSMAVTIAAFNGLGYEFAWSSYPILMPVLSKLMPSIAMLTLLLFTRRMLSTATTMPRLDVGLRTCALFNAGMPVLLFAAFNQTVWVAYLLITLSTMLILLAGVNGSLQRQRSAYFFLLAFSVLCVTLIVMQLRPFGIFPSLASTTAGIQLGSALEMILLAFALADRYHLLRLEKERAQTQALAAQQREVAVLQASERELEARVQARTAELTATLQHLEHARDDLMQAEKLASLGALVAGVAHELNTPIGNALTTATALQDRMRSFGLKVQRGELRRSELDAWVADSQEMADLIGRACMRAGELIISFKQVAVDQTSEQRRTFDLRTLVEDNVDALRPSFRQVPWVITTDIPASAQCDSYPGPLGQIIVNLVQNAGLHAFAGKESGYLHIRAEVHHEKVTMYFQDNGTGMDAATQIRVFEPFFTTRLGQGGSGLGLSISRNIATRMLGGSLQVQSAPGEGTCFTLEFPCTAPWPVPGGAVATR